MSTLALLALFVGEIQLWVLAMLAVISKRWEVAFWALLGSHACDYAFRWIAKGSKP